MKRFIVGGEVEGIIVQRVTIKDIAKAADVSLGTVSKVLNGDQSVKEANRLAVEQAVQALGYNVNKVARSLAHKPIKIGIMLPHVFEEYFDPMVRGIARVVDSLADYKVSAVYKSYEKFDDDETVAECLEYFISEDVSGILLGPFHHIGAYSGVMTALKKHQIPVVLVLSDLEQTQRLACISVDARLSGKTAAELASLVMKPHEAAAVFVGNKDVTEHRTKAESFCGRMQELNCKTIGVFETQDESELAYQLTVSTLKQYPQLRLIYVATGNSVAVCRAICDHGRQAEVQAIATDLLGGLQNYIKQGIVIGALDQHLEEQGAVAVTTLYQYLTEGTLESSEIKIAPSVLLQSGMLEQFDTHE